MGLPFPLEILFPWSSLPQTSANAINFSAVLTIGGSKLPVKFNHL